MRWRKTHTFQSPMTHTAQKTSFFFFFLQQHLLLAVYQRRNLLYVYKRQKSPHPRVNTYENTFEIGADLGYVVLSDITDNYS